MHLIDLRQTDGNHQHRLPRRVDNEGGVGPMLCPRVEVSGAIKQIKKNLPERPLSLTPDSGKNYAVL